MTIDNLHILKTNKLTGLDCTGLAWLMVKA